MVEMKNFEVESKTLGITRNYKIDFEGVANFIENTIDDNDSTSLKRWAKDYMDKIECPECRWQHDYEKNRFTLK